jgi:nicotinamidase-related amidase
MTHALVVVDGQNDFCSGFEGRTDPAQQGGQTLEHDLRAHGVTEVTVVGIAVERMRAAGIDVR